MKRIAIARVAFCVAAPVLAAAANASGRPLAPDDFYRIQDVREPQVSPDGLQIAYLVSHYDRDADKRRTALWMVGWNGGDPIQLTRDARGVSAPKFSPDGRFVFTGSHDGVARLWDARSGYPVSEPLQSKGEITCIQFSPDGRRCLSIANSDALRLWDVMDPPVPVPAWFSGFVEAVAGKRLNARRDAEPVGREALQSFRQKFADERETDFYTRWANWFLYERLKEPAAAFVP
jgi:dipeptidyl aminopeptidase/acylaminoacyl peptidase